VGGGSAIDTAKGLRFILAAELTDESQVLSAMAGGSPAKGWLPLVAVPTTLSGAEYTRSFSVNDRAAGLKRSHMGNGVSASAIIYDPDVTVATPEKLWVGTGFVALDHALEVYVANAPHPVADALKSEAASTLFAKLSESRKPEALVARYDCLLAGWMADHSPLRTRSTGGGGTPWSHVLAYELAALAGIPYTVTASLTLGNSLRLLAENRLCARRQAELATRLGLNVSLPDAVDAYAQTLGMPTTPAAAGLSPEKLEEVARATAARADLNVDRCRRVLGAG
jgi:alcohol dehydrogenase class IV